MSREGALRKSIAQDLDAGKQRLDLSHRQRDGEVVSCHSGNWLRLIPLSTVRIEFQWPTTVGLCLDLRIRVVSCRIWSVENGLDLRFEVESLRNASPATVSRAGIIYVSTSDLGAILGQSSHVLGISFHIFPFFGRLGSFSGILADPAYGSRQDGQVGRE